MQFPDQCSVLNVVVKMTSKNDNCPTLIEHILSIKQSAAQRTRTSSKVGTLKRENSNNIEIIHMINFLKQGVY